MAWFRKEKKPKEAVEKQVAIPEGLWVKCDDCKEIVYRKEVEQNFNVCPKCGYHFRLSARERFEILFDDGKYKEFAGDIRSGDPRYTTLPEEDKREVMTWAIAAARALREENLRCLDALLRGIDPVLKGVP